MKKTKKRCTVCASHRYYARGLCRRCYMEKWQQGVCSVCKKEKAIFARGMCGTCYRHWTPPGYFEDGPNAS
jgi:hypothetical protein